MDINFVHFLQTGSHIHWHTFSQPVWLDDQWGHGSTILPAVFVPPLSVTGLMFWSVLELEEYGLHQSENSNISTKSDGLILAWSPKACTVKHDLSDELQGYKVLFLLGYFTMIAHAAHLPAPVCHAQDASFKKKLCLLTNQLFVRWHYHYHYH